MIEWHTELARTATTLGELLARDRAAEDPLDVDVAITARAAVLASAGNVLGHLVPRTRQPGPQGRRAVTVRLLERDPLRALGLILQQRPRPELSRSPSELLDPAVSSGGATALWAAAGRHALLADRAWSASAPPHVAAEDAWRAIEQISAIIEAVALLDADIAQAHGGRKDIAAVLAAGQGMELVARRVGDLAAHPATYAELKASPTRPRPDASRIESIHRAGAPGLAAQAHRLTALLRTASELAPGHVRGAAAVGRDLAILAAPTATGSDGRDLRAELGDIARNLNAAVTSNHGESTVRRPLRQPALDLAITELGARTRAAFADRTTTVISPAQANALARTLPPLVSCLSAQARAQVAEHRWAVPNRVEGDTLPYTFASATDPAHRPPLFVDLHHARTAARALHERTREAPGDRAWLARITAAGACADLRDAIRSRGPHWPRTADPFEPPEAHCIGKWLR